MTAPALETGGYRFSHVARMEWLKLRSLRSTWWTLAISAAGALAIALAVGAHTKDASSDLTNNALAGIVPGLLFTGVLGVLVMTSEYTSGMIGSTLAAVPNRPLLLAAKTAVFAAVALAVGELAAFVAFFASRLALPATIPPPTLSQPGVLRAVLMAGAAFCLIGLIGLGLGAIIRNTAVAITVFVGGVFVGAQFIAEFAQGAVAYVPIGIVANALAEATPPWAGPSPWTGFAVLSLYAIVTLGVGTGCLARRDA